MKNVIFAACALILLNCAAMAQLNLTLKVVKTFPTTDSTNMIQIPVKCDDSGNVYMRGYAYPHPMSAPIVRISSDGEKIETVDLKSVPDIFKKDWGIDDYTVDRRGDLHVLESGDKGAYLVTFDNDLEFQSSSKIELKYAVLRSIAAFSPDLFFVSGTLVPHDKVPARRFNYILNSSGQILKTLDLNGANGTQGGESVEDLTGAAVSGDDGNVYMMLPATGAAEIFAISPAGTVVRKINVASPIKDGTPLEFRTTSGRIMVEFNKTEENKPDVTAFELVNSQSGEKIATYNTTPALGGTLACYTLNGLVFISSDHGKNSLEVAKPE